MIILLLQVNFIKKLDEKYTDVILLRYINQYGADDVYLVRDGETIPYSEVK